MVNKSNVNTTKNTECKPRLTAIWNGEAIAIFCDECIKEVEAGHRPGTHFSRLGWENLVTNFSKATGRQYDKVQLKNKWDSLKDDWKLWKELVGKETGLRWSSIKKTIDASDEWWQSKLEENPSAAKFRKKGIDPEMLEKLDRMFMTVTSTSGGAFAPPLDEHSSECQEETKDDANLVESSDESDDSIQIKDAKSMKRKENIEGKSKKRSSSQHTQVKNEKNDKVGEGKVGGATKLSQQIERLCETRNSITEKWLKGSQGSIISEVVVLLESLPGVEHASELWFSAIDLFRSSKDDRDIFCSIKDSEKRLKWLNYELAKK